MQNNLLNTLERIERDKKAYDEACKRILLNKSILAHILKELISEYKDESIDDIINKYLSNENEFKIDYENMSNDNTEDETMPGAMIRYDILLTLFVPTASGEKVVIIVNIEAQNYSDIKELIKRAEYYSSRLISRQKNHEYGFKNDNYQDLKKVYSIWICTKGKKEHRNTINHYHFSEDHIYGNCQLNKEDYDFINIWFLILGDNFEHESEVLTLLNILFSTITSIGDKSKMLEKHDIIMTKELGQEVDAMISLNESYYDEGFEQGLILGARKTKYDIICTLIESGMKLEDIARILKFELSDIQELINDFNE